MTLEPVVAKLEKFILYETHSFLYVVGCDKRQREYRVLKLDRKVRQKSRAGTIRSAGIVAEAPRHNSGGCYIQSCVWPIRRSPTVLNPVFPFPR